MSHQDRELEKAQDQAQPEEERSSPSAASPGASPTSSAASEAARKQALRNNHWLLLATVGFVILISGQAIYKSLVGNTRGSLSLPTLAEETTQLPPALASAALPLESLHHDLSGSHLDKPRAFVALYAAGRSLGSAWGEGAGLQDAIHKAWTAPQLRPDQATHAVLVVATDRTKINPNAIGRSFSNVHKGVLGAMVESPQGDFLLSPIQCVTSNQSIEELLKAEAKRRKLDYEDWIKSARVFSVSARQFYIPLKPGKPATELLRGNVVIKSSEVTQQSVQYFEKLLTEWLFNNLAPNGRLTYIYYPSTGRESKSNNMIRQWMGSVAMGRAARIHDDSQAAELSYKNIRYNLTEFYRSEGELGYIDYENEAKLGAAALALIAVIESPRRAELAEYERGLLNTTLHLWQPNGRFNTFLKPANRNDDNHNFYPGETLLAWSFLYAQSGDADLLDKSMKSFVHYKEWHLKNRNPAFIPWHTQAYYQLYRKTQNAALKDWIFEMNDWLVDVMQTNSRVAYDDTIGRFYDPTSNRYGVPHASSTGVYLEGLIDAFVLAKAVGDKAHAEKYRKSIILGLRSGMQLQFQDDIDMFYAGHHERLRGGMRTTEYNNEIRVDNVQHILMGVQKILKEFTLDDYRYTP